MKLNALLAAVATLLAACTSTPAPPAAATAESAAIEVMILGTYHFGNPGADLSNAQIDPVTTPDKQAQLQAVADGLARFKPTVIAVERVASDQATMLDHRYPAFKPEDLTTNPDERAQIGYRLANQLGIDRVYAIDEQDREGEMSYFPFELVMDWADKHGRSGELQASLAEVQKMTASLEARQKTETVGQLLADFNDRSAPLGEGGHGFYMGLLGFGAGADQPGAVLNGRWYTRNAVIFAKLRQTARPGDRIIVVYGAGHSYWLRQLVETTPGFRLVDATDYLPR